MMKKSISENKKPMKVLREVDTICGGVMQAQSMCELPRDRRQVYNLKQASKGHSDSACTNDTLAYVMQKCKETSSGVDVFIRSVEAAPEPMCMLATNQQLYDMERFCTKSPSSVLSIDPTFNLGPFYVTPTTFCNLMVHNKQGCHPIIIGPILIHRTKRFEPFHYFASTLVRLNPMLATIKAFGTDGEPQLIKAFSVCFSQAIHLRCVNHLNVKVDYLIIRHEDSRMRYKRGCPGQKPYLSIFVRYEEARRSWEHFRVSFKLLLLRNTRPDHLYLRATSPYRHVCSNSTQCLCPGHTPFILRLHL